MRADGQIEALIASIRLTTIATVVTDPRLPDNPVVAVNEAFEQLTGYGAGEAVGRNCRFLRGPGTDPEASDALRQAVAHGRPAMVELLNYRRDGSSFHNAVMVAPVFDEEGRPALFIGSQMEVPGRAEAGARAMQARQRVQRLTRRQRDVLKLMGQGLLNKQIAYSLGISEKTVKMHRAALMAALEARVSADAIRIAVEAGF